MPFFVMSLPFYNTRPCRSAEIHFRLADFFQEVILFFFHFMQNPASSGAMPMEHPPPRAGVIPSPKYSPRSQWAQFEHLLLNTKSPHIWVLYPLPGRSTTSLCPGCEHLPCLHPEYRM